MVSLNWLALKSWRLGRVAVLTLRGWWKWNGKPDLPDKGNTLGPIDDSTNSFLLPNLLLCVFCLISLFCSSPGIQIPLVIMIGLFGRGVFINRWETLKISLTNLLIYFGAAWKLLAPCLLKYFIAIGLGILDLIGSLLIWILGYSLFGIQLSF